MPPRNEKQYEYDVCLSFAGEDRAYVSAVARKLSAKGVRIFYDAYEEAALWGKDLYEHLHAVYGELARFCVVFTSRHYKKKLWTNHERRSAQERAFKQHEEYVLPARFDGTEIPGMRGTVGYIDLAKKTPGALAELIIKKIGVRQGRDYFPPQPDRLLTLRPLDGEKRLEVINSRARSFYEAMRRTDERERRVVFELLLHGCPADLPENVHVNLDLLRRVTGIAPMELKRIVGGLSSLGFVARTSRGHKGEKELVKQEFLELRFHSLNGDASGPATQIAYEMAHLVSKDKCEECGIKALMTLDFGQLSSATHQRDRHRRQRRRASLTISPSL